MRRINRDSQRDTQILVVDPSRPEPEAIERAAKAIQHGHLVAFPTETVYGLGANALNPFAVERIFGAKGRPADNPLIVHIAGSHELLTVASEVPERAWDLISMFWPGPLTLVLRRSPRIPGITAGGLETVAVRVPAHPVALALLRAAGCPIAAPSANRSGRPSPTCAAHVLDDLAGRVHLLLDGGPCPIGVESTVLDLTEQPPVILRPGGVSQEALETVLGKLRIADGESQLARRSPGARYRHYAPRADVRLVAPGEARTVAERLVLQGKRVGVMTQRPFPLASPNLILRMMPQQPEGYARDLFAALRDLDTLSCEVIVAEVVDERGLGMAIMDRLRRAASRGTVERPTPEEPTASTRGQTPDVEVKTLYG